jgi:hypothetical protein
MRVEEMSLDDKLRDKLAVVTAAGEPAIADVSARNVALLALYLVAWNFGLIAALIVLGPGSEELLSVEPPPIEIRYLLISMTAGGLGSMMPLMLSLASYVGNRVLRPSWILWYLLRPVIGMTIGIVIYIVIRGGILKVGSSPDQLNQYAMAGFSLLGGLFSKEILDRARSWADHIEVSR